MITALKPRPEASSRRSSKRRVRITGPESVNKSATLPRTKPVLIDLGSDSEDFEILETGASDGLEDMDVDSDLGRLFFFLLKHR